MAQRIISGAKMYMASLNISPEVSSFQLTNQAQLVENSGFSATAISRKVGLKDGAFSFEGFWNDPVDSELFTNIGSSSVLISMLPETETIGDPAFFFNAYNSSYTLGGNINEMHATNVSGEIDGDVYAGTYALFTDQTSEIGDALQLGAVGASQSIYIGFTVLSFTGTNYYFQLQSDDNAGFTSPVTRITTTTETTAVNGIESVAGSITDTYWRANAQVAGTTLESRVYIAIL